MGRQGQPKGQPGGHQSLEYPWEHQGQQLEGTLPGLRLAPWGQSYLFGGVRGEEGRRVRQIPLFRMPGTVPFACCIDSLVF